MALARSRMKPHAWVCLAATLAVSCSDGAVSFDAGFGISVALDGDLAIVGAMRGGIDEDPAGAAYAFRWTVNGWENAGRLDPGSSGNATVLGHVAATSEGRVLIGARPTSGSGSGGVAYVFEERGKEFVAGRGLEAEGACDRCRFGQSLDVLGDLAVVGETQTSAGGALHIFERANGRWSEARVLTLEDQGPAGNLGHDVAIGSRLWLVASDLTGASGTAHIFSKDEMRDEGNWFYDARLSPGLLEPGDMYGCSVGADAYRVVVGAAGTAPRPPDQQGSEGAAYVFERVDSGFWQEVGRLEASDPALGSLFGGVVDVSGDVVVIGAPAANEGRGAVYVFEIRYTGWTQTARLAPRDLDRGASFGSALDADGRRILVGAASQGGNGAAYLFERSAGDWALSAELELPEPGP